MNKKLLDFLRLLQNNKGKAIRVSISTGGGAVLIIGNFVDYDEGNNILKLSQAAISPTISLGTDFSTISTAISGWGSDLTQ